MNDNICKDRIKLNIEQMGPDVKFLDTRLRMIKDERYVDEDKYIIAPSMYSKDTDTPVSFTYIMPSGSHSKKYSDYSCLSLQGKLFR